MTESTDPLEVARAYGDTIRSLEGPARELAGLRYASSIANDLGEHERVAEISDQIARLLGEHPELE